MPRSKPLEQQLDHYEQWFLDNPLAYVSQIKAIQALLPKSGDGWTSGWARGAWQ